MHFSLEITFGNNHIENISLNFKLSKYTPLVIPPQNEASDTKKYYL